MIIGLTGGIGSGKTAVTEILKAKNAYIIDADIVSREVTAEGTECNKKLKAAFKDCAPGGKLDRKLLKQRVFAVKDDLLRLNSLTHPYILDEIKRRLNGKELAVVCVPLLFESGFDALCDLTVCVSSPYEDRISRIIKRDKIGRELAEKIIGAQMPEQYLKEKCDRVICNDGDKKQLQKRVEEWWKSVIAH